MIPVKSTFTSTRHIDPITLKEELELGFPAYTVAYSVMTDRFKLRNKDVEHILLFNLNKPNKIESISRKLKRKLFVYNLVVSLLVGVLVIGNFEFIERKIFTVVSSENFIFLSILFLGLFQYLIYLLHPGEKRDLDREHGEVRERLEVIFSKLNHMKSAIE